MVLRLTDAARGATPGAVSVRIPASTLAGLFGADYGSRVSWVQLPSYTTRSALSRATVRPTVIPSSQGSSGATVVRPQVSNRPVLLAMTSGSTSSGGAGTWAATSLRSSSSWQVSTQAGDFDWSYPFRTPPAAAGPSPKLALSYDSGSVDGETASTNNQSSVVGDGWKLAGTGFIERSYLPCAKDGTGLTAEQLASGDLCWNGDHDVLSFAGHSGPLVPTGTAGEFRIQGDDGSRVRYLPHSSTCGDGGHDNGCWQLTTQNGAVYFFGRDSTSAWTVPVFGDDSADECYGATFATSVCTQTWRWNLDRVVDIHGNAENFHYSTETNYYHQDNGGLAPYVRGGYLSGVDYGIGSGTTTVSDQVLLGYDQYGRCNASANQATNCALVNGKASNPQYFPDVPWDQYCSAGDACAGVNTPTFFTNEMLDTVTTQALVGGTMTTADAWTLTHQFLDPGDTSAASMWLSAISHPGLSDTTFTPISLNNRVKFDTYLPLAKQRIAAVNLDTGGIIAVTYDSQDCTASLVSTLNPATNTHQCFPQWWTPDGGSPMLDWFNKYRLKQVSETPVTGRTADTGTLTSYVYTSDPAWRLDLSPETSESDRTWSTFAGYKTVEVRKGDSGSASKQLTTDYQYFQGMDHDPDGTGSDAFRTATLSGGGHTQADSIWFAGRLFETTVRLGSSGGAGQSTTPAISDTVTVPWALSSAASSQTVTFANPAGTGTYSASVDDGAYLIGDDSSYASSAVAAGGTRTVTTTTTHDSYGRGTAVETVTPDAGTSCTKTSYADNSAAWLLDRPSRVYTVGVSCAATPSYPNDAVSDTRYFYDGATTYTGQSPTEGNLTRTDVVNDYNGSGGSAESVTTAASPADSTGYDAMGRQPKTTDAAGRTTSNVFNPVAGGPLLGNTVTVSATGLTPLTTSTGYSPLWGSPTSLTDPNGNLTTATLDSLGRESQVWLPDRPVSAGVHTGTPSVAYSYLDTNSQALETTTSTLNSAGGTISSYEFADGLGRPVQTQVAMDSFISGSHVIGGTVLTDTYYDEAGQVRLINNAYGNAGITPSTSLYNPQTETQVPSETETTWDGAGRKTAEITLGVRSDSTFGELWRTGYGYPGTDRTDVTPPLGGTPTSTSTDSLGRATYLDQYLGATPTGTKVRTGYGYDARGDMTSMTDNASHTWTWQYDPRGGLTSSTDPDTGTTTNTYDDASHLTDTKDGAGNKLHYAYDALGRKTFEYEYSTTPTAGNEAQVASWAYDTATLGKGLLASESSYVGSTNTTVGTAYTKNTTKYDPNGKPLTISTVIPNWNGGGLPRLWLTPEL